MESKFFLSKYYFKKFLQKILDFVIPNRCLSCADYIDSEHNLCSKCWGKINFISKPYCVKCGSPIEINLNIDVTCLECINLPPKFTLSRSLCKFDDNVKKIIHNFKYYDKTSISKFFAKLIFNLYAHDFQNADLIIPVPMHKIKRILRRYNQSQILAFEIGKIFNKHVLNNVLIKIKNTKSQSLLSKKERKSNLKNSIIIKNPELIKGKSIILVDDVITTGTTIDYCCKLLKMAGVKKIYVCSIAKTSKN